MRATMLTFLCAVITSLSVEAQIDKDNTSTLIPKAYLKIDGTVHWFMEPIEESNDLNTATLNVYGAVPGMTVMKNENGTDILGFRVNREGTYVDSVYFLITSLQGSCGMSDLEFRGGYTGIIDPQTGTAEINLTCAPGLFPGFSFLIDFNAKTAALTILEISNCNACSAVQFSFAPTDVEILNTDTPDKFYLSQNFPNPFNPGTKINYSIPLSGFVTLKIYDIMGNEIATLVNEEKSAGNYEVEFDGSNLSSGLYFYTINTGSFSQVKKMILLK
jgi:hypothetical protein